MAGSRIPVCRGWILVIVLIGCILASIGLRWAEQWVGEKPYSLLEDRLYVGCAVAVPPPGTQAVLNLCDKEDPYRVETHLWEPLDGTQAPSLDQLERLVKFIHAQRQVRTTIYVHCLAGMNRSGMVVTAYLMYEHGWDRDTALAFVQAKRPEVQPNPTLMRGLAEWERLLQARVSIGR